MVCGDDINAVLDHSLEQCGAIFDGFDRRIAFDKCSALLVVIGAEKQVVDAGFGSNALILQRPNLKQRHFFRRREVQYMQLGAEFFRKTYGQ